MGTVIAIASRRLPLLANVGPQAPAPSVPNRRPHAIAFLAAAAALLAVVGGVHWYSAAQIRELSLVDRAPVFARSIDDLRTSCAAAEAEGGALREHCVQQAEFVTLFPECDPGCQALARSVLPRPRR